MGSEMCIRDRFIIKLFSVISWHWETLGTELSEIAAVLGLNSVADLGIRDLAMKTFYKNMCDWPFGQYYTKTLVVLVIMCLKICPVPKILP